MGGTGGGTGGGGGVLPGDTCATAEALSFSGGTAVASGSLSGYGDHLQPSCASIARPDRVYAFSVTGTQDATVTIEASGSWRPVVALYTFTGTTCGGSALMCEAATTNGGAATFTTALTTGNYAVVVDSASGAGESSYALTVGLSGGPPPPDAGMPSVLSNGVSVPVSGALSSETVFMVNITGSSSQLVFNLVVGTGDADLYERAGAPPDLANNLVDQASEQVGNDTITVPTPAPGTYYVTVYGYEAFTGATLTATW
jgi:hypothetical protein